MMLFCNLVHIYVYTIVRGRFHGYVRIKDSNLGHISIKSSPSMPMANVIISFNRNVSVDNETVTLEDIVLVASSVNMCHLQTLYNVLLHRCGTNCHNIYSVLNIRQFKCLLKYFLFSYLNDQEASSFIYF